MTATARAVGVTVIMCVYTRDRWKDIELAVEALRQQTLPPDEILIVVDHNDQLYELCAGLADDTDVVRIVRNSNAKGLSGARNQGIELSRYSLVAFLDDDAVPAVDWLATLTSPFSDPAVMVTGGHATPVWPMRAPSWFPEEFNWVVGCSYLGLPVAREEVRNVIGCSMAFRAEGFDRVGGFTDGIGRVGNVPLGCEETELCIRLRKAMPLATIVYVPDSFVYHRVSPDRTAAKYFFRRCYFEGISKAYIGALVGDGESTSSERDYATKVLPAGIVRNLRYRPLGAGGARALAILSGLAVTIFGYAVGLLRRGRRSHGAV